MRFCVGGEEDALDCSPTRRFSALRLSRNPATSRFLVPFSCRVSGLPSVGFRDRARALPYRDVALACPVHALPFSSNTLSPRRKRAGLTGRAVISTVALIPWSWRDFKY